LTGEFLKIFLIFLFSKVIHSYINQHLQTTNQLVCF